MTISKRYQDFIIDDDGVTWTVSCFDEVEEVLVKMVVEWHELNKFVAERFCEGDSRAASFILSQIGLEETYDLLKRYFRKIMGQ